MLVVLGDLVAGEAENKANLSSVVDKVEVEAEPDMQKSETHATEGRRDYIPISEISSTIPISCII